MPLAPNDLLQQLSWRYAVRRFDPSRKIPADDWQTLEQSLILAPSSFGLQPWKFLVIDDPAVRQQLLPLSWNQQQVVQASHLVVFAVRDPFGLDDIDRHVARMAEVQGVPVESLKRFREIVAQFIDSPGFDVRDWATFQVYIALGVFLTSAAVLGIDACPMEGFQPRAYDEALGLRSQGYGSVVVAAAGYRDPTDKYANLPKVRFPAGEVIQHVGTTNHTNGEKISRKDAKRSAKAQRGRAG